MGPRALDAFLEALVAPLAKKLELTHFTTNFPLLAYAALGFTVIHVGIAPVLSKWLAPESYAKLKGRRARNNWCVPTLASSLLACDRLVISTYGARV